MLHGVVVFASRCDTVAGETSLIQGGELDFR